MIPAPTAEFEAAEISAAPRFTIIVTMGDYEVPSSDIIDPGTLTIERSLNIGELVAPQYNLTLDNRSGKYDPNASNSIWPEGVWYHQSLTLSLAYYRPYADGLHPDDRILLFQGLITTCELAWEPDSQRGGVMPSVQITAMGLISALLEQKVGKPDSTGRPSPLIYGTVTKPARDVADDYFWQPYKLADAETGDTSQWDSVTANNGAIFRATSDSGKRYEGNYGYEAIISSGVPSQQAFGRFYSNSSSSVTGLFSFMFKLGSVSNIYNRNPYIVEFCNSAGTSVINIAFNTYGYLQLYVYGYGVVNCDLHYTELMGVWTRLSVLADLAVPGTVRVYRNGDVIGEAKASYAFVYSYVDCGFIKPSYVATGWEAYIDNCKLYTDCYPLGYYLPGAPFLSITGAYVDGAVMPEEAPSYYYHREGRAEYQRPWIKAVYGRYVSTALYAKQESKGMVSFNDLNNPPSGTILIRATKNNITHPVIIIADIIENVGLSYDTVSFTAAYNQRPGDAIGCYYDNRSAGDAVADICKKCLYHLDEDAGLIRLQTIEAAPSPSAVIGLSDWLSCSIRYDTTQLYSIYSAKYGFYEKDNKLYYTQEDAETKAIIGDVVKDVSYEISEDVSSESSSMVEAMISRMALRFSKPIEICRLTVALKWARLMVGDVVGVVVGGGIRYYTVNGKTIDFGAATIYLTLVRYLGVGA